MRRAHTTLLLSSLAIFGCTSTIDGKGYGTPSGTAGTSSGMAGTGNSAGAPTTEECVAPAKPLAQRVVRLTYSQYENGIRGLLGSTALDGVSVEDPRRREFQALFAEGDLVNTQVLQKSVSLSETASGALSTKYAALTGCASNTDEVCANAFLLRFAEQAYRRPLVAEEKTSLAQLYTDAKTLQGSVPEALKSAVLGVLVAPQAMYRYELGAAGSDPKQIKLTGYEVASSLSYFLLDGPPDAGLLAAAAANQLGTAAEIGKEVDRLLAQDSVKKNLTDIMVAYYGLKELDGTTKDSQVYPDFSVGVRNSMYTETKMFIEDTLWHGSVADLLTSRKTFINDTLAKFYGVTYPAASGSAFVPFEFPVGQRSGVVTHGSVMATRARTDTTSVVSRGLFINSLLLCSQSPPPPPAAVQEKVDEQLNDKNATERDKAAFRDSTSPCNSCHRNFDGFGLVLENFDGIGKLRTSYSNGTPIDTTGELPASAGGGTVPDANAFMAQIAGNGAFSRCLTSNLMKYALADVSLVDVRDCNVQKTHDAFQATDRSFPSLIKQITSEHLLATRTIESTP